MRDLKILLVIVGVILGGLLGTYLYFRWPVPKTQEPPPIVSPVPPTTPPPTTPEKPKPKPLTLYELGYEDGIEGRSRDTGNWIYAEYRRGYREGLKDRKVAEPSMDQQRIDDR